jgi:glycerol-3-phosphate O-acyltransferase
MVFVAYIGKMLGRLLTGRLYKNGYACVSFGDPVSMKAYLAERRFDFRTLPETDRQQAIDALGRDLMTAVARAVPALPVSLVATAVLDASPAALTDFELKGRVFSLMRQIEAGGGYVHIPRDDRAYAIDVGVRLLAMRRLIFVQGDVVTANPAESALLQYYANAITCLLATDRLSRAPVEH